jgi:Zn-dependent M28 family amino/carboxypeptidase
VLYVQDSSLPKRVRKASIDIHSKLDPAAKSANVMGMVRGTEVPDSFIVFTAHYDHLGKMGWDATFPGASDNASGTACMEWLAAHYARNPQRYSMLFIAFSGEEAGLKGSSYSVAHPLVPLERMRFLVNLDIMGNAQDGVTVVNATEHPQEFSLLESLNKKSAYLPQIRSRGKAANSDHYPFSEAGVPAFFLYSNGGAGYYHDIFDKPATLALTNIDKVLKLLMDFVGAMQ